MLDAAIDAAHIIGHPPEVDTTYYWRPFVKRAAALGVRTILSGNGGDHATTNSGDLLFRELALRREWALLARYRFRQFARWLRAGLAVHGRPASSRPRAHAYARTLARRPQLPGSFGPRDRRISGSRNTWRSRLD